MRKRVLPSIHGLLLVTAGAFTACEKKAAGPTMVMPPPLVLVAEVTQQDVPVYVENLGHTQADETVEIRARVPGYLVSAPFEQGGRVSKGDVLFQIDPRPYEAAVDQMKANVAKAEAAQVRANSEVNRLRPLLNANAISKQEFDNADATAKEVGAEVLAAKAALTTAELDLGYTEMRAPFDGLIGARQIDVGNFVSVSGGGNTLLATVSTTDPMRVAFTVAETNYIRYQKRFMGDEAAAKQHSDSMQFELILADGSVYPHKGSFAFAERSLDQPTGTLQIVVKFPNPEMLLRPSQFARVRARAEERKGAVLVPKRAVITTQSARSVLVVGADNKVAARPIKVDGDFEDKWIVTDGLAVGERVIVEGVQKAPPGSEVRAELESAAQPPAVAPPEKPPVEPAAPAAETAPPTPPAASEEKSPETAPASANP